MLTKKTVALSLDGDDDVFLRQRGICRSKFFRQAIEKLKSGEIEYDYLRCD